MIIYLTTAFQRKVQEVEVEKTFADVGGWGRICHFVSQLKWEAKSVKSGAGGGPSGKGCLVWLSGSGCKWDWFWFLGSSTKDE